MWLIKLILGPLFDMIGGWWSKRQETIALTKAQDNQAHADADAAVVTTKVQTEIEHAREQTNSAVVAATADAGDPDKLRDDVQRAIDAANADNRLQ
jgi:hypothetical protein